MSVGMSWFVIVLTGLNIAGMAWLFLANNKVKAGQSADGEASHCWDGDLTELNNPLPRWWLWLFFGSLVFSLVYLALYPGMGNFRGLLGWSTDRQLAAQVSRAEAAQAPRYERYAAMSLPELSRDPEAMATARSLFANDCAGCHGSDARGAAGFPNLTDNAWLYGGEPDTVLATIGSGRMGVMPAWQAVLGDGGVNEVVAYVLTLEGRTGGAPALVEAGAQKYATFCVACHGPQGKGNPVLGAPDLTDGWFMYGGDEATLRTTIATGRQGQMPAFNTLLGPDRVRLMAAYVLSLSAGQGHDVPGGG